MDNLRTTLLVCLILGVTLPASASIVGKEVIDMKVAELDRNKIQFQRFNMNTEGLSTEGGHVMSYCDGGKVMIAESEVFDESGKNVTSYYFDRGSLIYVGETIVKYNRPQYVRGARRTKEEYRKYYFQNEKILIKISDNRDIDEEEMTAFIMGGLKEVKDYIACN